MRRHQFHTVAVVLMWIGGSEIIASFLAKFWVQYSIPFTPWFFLAFIIGIVLYLLVRVV